MKKVLNWKPQINIRKGLNKDLGFKLEDRVENIRRVGETSKLMIDAGYDWLCIDLEHGEIFEKDLFGMISLIQSNGIPCIVRVRSKTEHEYRKIAELGASGVIIPSIETTEVPLRTNDSLK